MLRQPTIETTLITMRTLWKLCAACLACSILASGVVAADAEREYFALVVGVGKYPPTKFRNLPGAEPDADELARTLIDRGFRKENVTVLTNSRGGNADPLLTPNAENIRREIDLLLDNRKETDVVLIALAGHGLQLKGQPYVFCPFDADAELKKNLISIDELYKHLEKSKAEFKLLLVDACRQDTLAPAARNNLPDELASVTRPSIAKPPGGVAAFFSCTQGQVARERTDDGRDGKPVSHGLFFHAVIRGLQGEAADAQGELTLPDLEKFVKRDVETYSRVTLRVKQYPELLNQTRGLPSLVPKSVSAGIITEGKRAGELREFASPKIKFRWCPPGAFKMGSPENETDRDDDEGGSDGKPVDVTLTGGFWTGQTELTIGQWFDLKDPTWKTGAFRSSDEDDDGQGRRCRVTMTPNDAGIGENATLTIEYDLPKGQFIQSEANRKGIGSLPLHNALLWGVEVQDSKLLAMTTNNETTDYWDADKTTRLWKYYGKSQWKCDLKITRPEFGVMILMGMGHHGLFGSGPDTFHRPLFLAKFNHRLNSRPVCSLSWEQASQWCLELTSREKQLGRLPNGWEYRLPSEAQWEFACRAGTTTTFAFGDNAAKLEEYAWLDSKTSDAVHDVATKKPSHWGIHDMHGNVEEWCEDGYGSALPGGRDPLVLPNPVKTRKAPERVVRSFAYSQSACRSASRLGRDSPRAGFRIILTPSSKYLHHLPRDNPNRKAPSA